MKVLPGNSLKPRLTEWSLGVPIPARSARVWVHYSGILPNVTWYYGILHDIPCDDTLYYGMLPWFWINCIISLTWIKAIKGNHFPLKNHRFQWGRSEVVAIYSVWWFVETLWQWVIFFVQAECTLWQEWLIVDNIGILLDTLWYPNITMGNHRF